MKTAARQLREPPDPSVEFFTSPPEHWLLRLYVAGESTKSLEAFVNLQHLCAVHLAGRHTIEVVDVLESPELAQEADIIAIPTLVRMQPTPPRRIIGDLSDTHRVLVGLQLPPQSP